MADPRKRARIAKAKSMARSLLREGYKANLATADISTVRSAGQVSPLSRYRRAAQMTHDARFAKVRNA
jgi:hypothetical protein